MNFLLPLNFNKKVEYNKIKKYLKPGSVLLTNNFSSKTFVINPSPIKHGAIYFGKNIYSEIKKLYQDIDEYIKYDEYNFFKPKLETIIPTKLLYIKEIIDNVDLDSLQKKLKETTFQLMNENIDNDEYIVEITDKGPRIDVIHNFLKSKNELFIYDYDDEHVMYTASRKSLYFLGTRYAFEKNKKCKYCFEMIIKAYELSDINFKVITVIIAFDHHYNSLSITENKNFKLVYKS